MSYIEYLGIESCFLVVVSKIFYVHPLLGEMIPSLTSIFFKWVGSTTNQLFIFDRSWVISIDTFARSLSGVHGIESHSRQARVHGPGFVFQVDFFCGFLPVVNEPPFFT